MHAIAVLAVVMTACDRGRTSSDASNPITKSAEERIARWTREHPGEPLTAAISFHSLQPDSTIVNLLARHDVRPYIAHAWAGGVSTYAQLAPEHASVDVIANARTQLMQRLARNVCNVAPRIQGFLEDQRRVSSRDTTRAAGDDSIVRNMLSRLRAEEEGLAHVRAGGAVVWAVYVTGTPDAVRRVGEDPLVASFEPVEITTEEGQPLVGVPRPAEPKPVGELPKFADIDALTSAEVRARIEQLAQQSQQDCPPPPAAHGAIPGSWIVAARRDGRVVIVEQTSRGAGTRPRSQQPGEEPPPKALIFAPDEPLQPLLLESLDIVLPGVPPERARPLRVGRVRLGGRDVYVSVPGWSPPLLASPTDPALYLFAEANALWTFQNPTSVRRATAERVGTFDYATLAAKQQEGRVILYWADAPAWSPDGRQIVYVTNREAVHSATNGQALWLLDLETAQERPLLSEPGESFYPTGWLGGELTFSGPPGVRAIDPVTDARRQLAAGATIAAAHDGAALAIADGVPDVTRITVFTATATQTVPPPPAGTTYAAQAAFSPNAERLLLLATTRDGRGRRFFIFDRRSGRVAPLATPTDTLNDWPAWLDDDHLLLNVVDPGTQQTSAHIIDTRIS